MLYVNMLNARKISLLKSYPGLHLLSSKLRSLIHLCMLTQLFLLYAEFFLSFNCSGKQGATLVQAIHQYVKYSLHLFVASSGAGEKIYVNIFPTPCILIETQQVCHLDLSIKMAIKLVSIFTSYTGTVLQIQLLECAFGWQYSFMYWPYRDKKRPWKKKLCSI